MDTQELTGGCDRANRPQEVLLTIGNVSAPALGAGFSESRERLEELPAMETPGEPRTGPLGAPYPASFASGHLEREKLVKLEGQPRWGGVEGGEPELGLFQGQGGGDGWANPCSGLVPPPRTLARPAQDPRYDVPGAGGVFKRRWPQS